MYSIVFFVKIWISHLTSVSFQFLYHIEPQTWNTTLESPQALWLTLRSWIWLEIFSNIIIYHFDRGANTCGTCILIWKIFIYYLCIVFSPDIFISLWDGIILYHFHCKTNINSKQIFFLLHFIVIFTWDANNCGGHYISFLSRKHRIIN